MRSTVEMAVQFDQPVMRVEPHRFDKVGGRRGSAHELSLDQALGPFITCYAVDDKPRSEPEPRDLRILAPIQASGSAR